MAANSPGVPGVPQACPRALHALTQVTLTRDGGITLSLFHR